MRRGMWSWLAVVLLVALLGAAACSKSSTASPKAKEDAYLDRANKAATGLGNQSGPAGQGASAVCTTDRQTLESAMETYRAAEGSEPKTMADLVPDYLKTAPPDWTIKVGSDGTAKTVRTPAGIRDGCNATDG